jgi:hypothetical protein
VDGLPWAGAGRVLNSLGIDRDEIAIPLPHRSREWLKVALVECHGAAPPGDAINNVSGHHS